MGKVSLEEEQHSSYKKSDLFLKFQIEKPRESPKRPEARGEGCEINIKFVHILQSVNANSTIRDRVAGWGYGVRC